MTDLLYDTQQAATFFGLAPGTLRKWRLNGRGPGFVRLGRSVRYRKAELEDFMATRLFSSTAAADAADRLR